MSARTPALMALLAEAGFAQCAQCFRTAAAQADASALNRGIAALLLPVLALLGGVCWMAWTRRRG